MTFFWRYYDKGVVRNFTFIFFMVGVFTAADFSAPVEPVDAWHSLNIANSELSIYQETFYRELGRSIYIDSLIKNDGRMQPGREHQLPFVSGDILRAVADHYCEGGHESLWETTRFLIF